VFKVSITEAAQQLSNFCFSRFNIVNDFALEVPKPTAKTVWAPYSIVGETGSGEFT